ncbi:MAG: hypothetical protein GC206_04105 [Alphaproteobacteria bacterium]|nr:hypothetical protein [Alphaproteobacteria bacterium]
MRALNRRLLISAALAAAGVAATGRVADAAVNADALMLYRAGDFLDAAQAATRAGGADNLALAARAMLALLVVDPRRGDFVDLAERAQQAAERALSLSTQSVEARLQIAIALGMRGRRMPVAQALREGLATRARAFLEEAGEIAPRDPWAQALLGGWHLEVWRRGGAVGAAALNANIGRGVAAFDRARALAPNDPAIAVHYAIALLGLGHGLLQERIEVMLQSAIGMRPRDALERHLIGVAATVQAALARDGMAAGLRAADAAFP